MNKKSIYKCKENDNQIRVIFVNDKIDEMHFRSQGDKGWTVIGIKDLKEALKIKSELK